MNSASQVSGTELLSSIAIVLCYMLFLLEKIISIVTVCTHSYFIMMAPCGGFNEKGLTHQGSCI